MESKKIFMLIDGSAIVHRAYHAMPPLTRKDGTPTGAVHGFFFMILRLIQEFRPAYITIAFDRPSPNFRQQLFKEYQSQRPKAASDLGPQFEIIQEILTEAKIPIYSMDGFEADDIIGTIAHSLVHGKKNDVNEVLIVTGDRDMMQLINSKVKVLLPIKGISEMKLFDEARVKEKFGVTPAQFIELKALQGDASDNYPGVAGVGPKTAGQLIQEFGSVKNIYDNLALIQKKNPRLGQKLQDGAEHAVLGHQLATILTEVPFEWSLEDCQMSKVSYAQWKKAFEHYEFTTLPKKLDEVFGNGEKKSQMKLL